MARSLSGGTLGNIVLLFMEELNRKNCPREEFDRFSMSARGAFGMDEFVLWFLMSFEDCWILVEAENRQKSGNSVQGNPIMM